MSRFQKAKREQLRLRMALDGPSGSGKSLTALMFATALGKNIAVIDSEHSSAKKYQGEPAGDLGVPLEFFHCDLTNFAPTEYTACIKEAAREGFDVLVIDGLSQAWAGEGGALELKDAKGGNQYTAWRDITPMHNRLVEAMLKFPGHLITTLRSKTEYVLENDEKGRLVPKKVGMAPIQRPGLEYEFDLYGSLDHTHTLKITKSRCSAVADAVVVKPGPTFMLPIIEWLNSGVRPELVGKAPPPRRDPIKPETLQVLKNTYGELAKAGTSAESWRSMLAAFGVHTSKDLAEVDAQELLEQCRAKLAKKQQMPPYVDILTREAAKEMESTPTPPAVQQTHAMCSPEQALEIDRLFGGLQWNVARVCAGIKKRYNIDCQDITRIYYQLTTLQADDLISMLKAKIANQ